MSSTQTQIMSCSDEEDMADFKPLKNHIYLASPTMHGGEQKYIQEAFDTNWVAPLGKNVNEFEKEMASYVGVKAATALSSGTAALHLSIKLAGVKPGDIVFCSDLTFAATVNPVYYEQGNQVFIDSELDTWNMDPVALEKAFEKYPECKLVIVTNLYGTPARFDEIQKICQAHHAILIEDAAESLSATYHGQKTGKFGKYNAISFNGNKIITTSGGGMLLSDDEEGIAKARFWATQARDPSPWYQHTEIGYNYRMSNIIAGIGRGQLPWIEEHKRLKKEIYERYKAGFQGLPVSMNPYMPCSEPNFWLSCIRIDDGVGLTPDQIRLKLADLNIESRPIWKPMHMQPVYMGHTFITSKDGIDVGGQVFTSGLCLPSDIKMSASDQAVIVDVIKSMFRRKGGKAMI